MALCGQAVSSLINQGIDNLELDTKTLAYGPITKYFNKKLLVTDLCWYKDAGYRIYELDAEIWYTIDDFHSACHEAFGFPGYYGRNWGAFDDVITDIESGPNGNILVCVLHFDSWHKREQDSAQIFLDIMADQTYSKLISGNKFVTLIHCKDPNFNTRKVGAKEVNWNWSEWNNADRGL